VDFDLTDPQQLKECFALSNLRPEIAADNYAAGAQMRGLSGAALAAAAAAAAGTAAAAGPSTPAGSGSTGRGAGCSEFGGGAVLGSKRQRWTDDEVALLLELQAMYDRGELGRKKDGVNKHDPAALCQSLFDKLVAYHNRRLRAALGPP
jgi:hypothetical protein